MPRIPAAGAWTFEIGPEFQVLHHGPSVQAAFGLRIVHLSSTRAEKAGATVPAAHLRRLIQPGLGPGERLSHYGPTTQGDATIALDDGTWRLKGAMCADGTVASCVIDLTGPEDRAWAVAVWRSLRCGPVLD